MGSKNLLCLLALVLLLASSGSCLKILGLFPHPGKSHFDIFQPLMAGLASKGHDVHVLSHFPNDPPIKNYTEHSLAGTMPVGSVALDRFASPIASNHFAEVFFLMELQRRTCEVVYSSPAVKKLIDSDHTFDVIIVETFQTECMLGIAHKFKSPTIALSSTPIIPWTNDRFGNPDNPSIIPVLFLGYQMEMTFLQRLNNFVTLNLMKIIYYYYSDVPSDRLIREVYGGDVPSVTELKKNTTLMLVNTHYSLFGVRPSVPAVVEMGGIHIKAEKPLQKELEDFINGAEHGVIYVSWGSMIQASTLPEHKRDALLKAFGSLKQRVLWKFENESLPGIPKNVMIKKWMPQRDVLAHKNVRVFMAHGGLLGTLEAVHCGVPVIGTPVYGDQFLNTAAMVSKGMAVQLSFHDLTTESVVQAINTVLQPSYAANAKKTSHLFRARPLPPLQTAIWWVEHVARTGGQHLRSPARNMPWWQYHLLDVITALVLGKFLILYAIYAAFKKCFSARRKTKTD